jgi:SAM-dependent methyltransferase
MPTPDVAPNGSPVAVYLALPAEPDLSRVRGVLPPNGSVLDLGCGVGRIANPLAAAGHSVVAVDDSAEMLARLAGPEPVLGDVWALNLRRRFDAVLALSHLINGREPALRSGLLGVCRRHLGANGKVVVQRYAPDWTPTEGVGTVGKVEVHLHDVALFEDGFSAQVTYRIGQQRWTQSFDGAIVDDAELASLAGAVGLSVVDTLDDTGAWVLLASAD